ncbi:cytoplasmic methionine-tRNA ligase Mrs1 [Schizosaccharomyces osmophilus]|uniref:methionine--tRNA ligase n=1 Tax=Schizosaccharomyces osmophilus TaxID=2545709 RepID=A0AAE9WA53_9SCHI|nr:cytoplasmic methionine-tRNA ligase Mrs1 [Schizosaccharomyces osmophilus]WBW72100.1 cytoplasmic methionine-tRNA ligase Mrs1 [Schizosaccharomyces osmophilus]
MATIKLQFPASLKTSYTFANSLKVAISIHEYGVKAPIEGAANCSSVRLLDAKDSEKFISDANAIVSYLYWQQKNVSFEEFLNSKMSILDWEALTFGHFVKEAAENKNFNQLLSLLQEIIKQDSVSENFTPVEIALVADIHFCVANGAGLEGYPELSKWYLKTEKNPSFVKALRVCLEKSLGQPAEISAKVPISTETRNVQTSSLMRERNPSEKLLPKANEANILITSALPYVNNVPHLGNIVGSTLSADVFARYHRARNHNTLYICGTDEYGTATETKALEEGMSPKELCDKYNVLHKQVYDWFEIEFDEFGRTTTPKQTEIAQHIFKKLHENGFMSADSMTQLYCEVHNGYLADRYVEGICPKCQYEDARGDQCDKCGGLLNAFELVEPKCKLDGSKPVKRETRHVFLSLDKLQPAVETWATEAAVEGKWTVNGRAITESWLKEGLRPRCITRDLKWGTPVPLEEFKDKVLYVWFDAPIGYISMTANYTDEWEKWWRNPEQVKLYQFMGKDNVPFHTVIFPSSLLGTKEKWTMLHHINTTDYLNYETGKFSKSRGVGVFGNTAQDIGLSPSVWRYYLLSTRPETSDTMFTWKDFITRHNSELLANVGNFVNRTLKFTTAKYNGIVPHYLENASVGAAKLKTDFVQDVNMLLKKYNAALEQSKLREGLRLAMEISARGNQYLQDNRVDNKCFLYERQKCADAIGYSLNLIYLLASIMYPYMPSVSSSINKQLNAPAMAITGDFSLPLLPGHRIGEPEYLFSRIDESMEEKWRIKYGGVDVQKETA